MSTYERACQLLSTKLLKLRLVQFDREIESIQMGLNDFVKINDKMLAIESVLKERVSNDKCK